MSWVPDVKKWFLLLTVCWLGSRLPEVRGATLLEPAVVRFEFREPLLRRYEVPVASVEDPASSPSRSWLYARRADRADETLEFSSRLILAPGPGGDAAALVRGRRLALAGELHPGFWLVQAPDAWTAAEEAELIGALPGVMACYPAMRYPAFTQNAYAQAPNDPYFPRQWHLENRDSQGHPLGIDIDVRAAWPWTRGENVLVAVVDDGAEMTHPDLQDRFAGNPHFNFGDQTTNAGPSLNTAWHSTAVSGLIAASADNHRGVSGVAPKAGLASWVIFHGSALAPDTVGMKQMFEYRSNVVQVQNHSWGAGGTSLYPLPPMEEIGISNAVTAGRGGLGVVLVQAASNGRGSLGDVNADGYASNPRVIAVAAARSDGRVTRYSNPGACVLVGAPSSETVQGGVDPDPSYPTLVTTDITGIGGRNSVVTVTDSADYRFDLAGFTGTSGATPLVSGIVALMLSANPALGYRDVQQALLLSSRHLDLADPTIQTNGAGLRVSHNLGFGIPDAGLAVQRARAWIRRPSPMRVTVGSASQKAIPDDGLRVEVAGTGIPAALTSIPATAALGVHADAPTGWFPLANIGTAPGPISTNLNGAAALCQRGGSTFVDKIRYAAAAGAPLIVIYNNSGTVDRLPMSYTDFSAIPAVLIGRTAGESLLQLIQTNATAVARIALQKAVYTLSVTNTLLCEHVSLKLQSDHPRRADMRVTLLSPSGTRSVLQRLNTDSNPFPTEGWTYYSVQHYFESSAGTWTVEVSDEDYVGGSGKVLRVDLTIEGVPILDTDHDGLEDGWEMAHFGNLGARAAEDPDRDGVPNSIEQLLQTNPLAPELPFQLDLTPWSSAVGRLSWPGIEGAAYRVLGADSPEGPYTELATIPGVFPNTEWITPLGRAGNLLLRVERVTPP